MNRLIAKGILIFIVLFTHTGSAFAQGSSMDWENYWDVRNISMDMEAGVTFLTTTDIEFVDYLPGFGFNLEYYLPIPIALGFEFEQSQKTGDLKLPTKNYGNLDANGRMTLTAYSFQVKYSSPMLENIFNVYFSAGAGGYVVNLNANTILSIEHQGEEYEFDYDFHYTVVENGFNVGFGTDIVPTDHFKVGINVKNHFILNQEEESDFGAFNVLIRIGYTL